MRELFESRSRSKPQHPFAWLWEPLEDEPSFALRSMFGAKAIYLDGKLQLCFIAKRDEWKGVLVGTDFSFQESLIRDFPALSPHPVLSKWLYLPESSPDFERVAQELVKLARKRDPRIGVAGSGRKRKKA